MDENQFKELLLQSELSPNARFVCLVLLQFRNRSTGQCYPSYITLSQSTGLCVNTIRKAIKELEDDGRITISQKRINRNKFTSNFYEFSVTSASGDCSNERSIDCSNDPAQDDTKPYNPINLSILKKEGAPDLFPIWYKEYPHKVRKPEAVKAFKSAIKKTTLEELLLGLERYKRSKPPDRPWCGGR